jgi:hypothetical protein
VDDRLVLVSLLKVLHKTGGLKTLLDANDLLEVGNYRTLNIGEKERVFPKETWEASIQSPGVDTGEQKTSPKFQPANIFTSPSNFQNLLNDAQDGPSPVWPRVVITLLRKLSDQIPVLSVFRALLWFWIWVAGYMVLAPSLYGSFHSGETVVVSIAEYITFGAS